MAKLYTKIISKPTDEHSSVSSISLKEEDFEISCPEYKGGKATTVPYTDVKGVWRGPNGTLTLKIKRTEFAVGQFDSESLLGITTAITVGQSGERVSESKAWHKYLNDCAKSERRVERRQKIADTIAGVKTGITEGVSNALSDCPEDIEEQKREQARERAEEKATQKRINEIRNELDKVRISLSDSEEEVSHKLTSLGNLCHKIVYGQDKYNEISGEAISVFEEGIEIAEVHFPNLEELNLAKSRVAKLKKQDKKNHSTTGCFIGIAIFVLILVAWWWLEKNNIL